MRSGSRQDNDLLPPDDLAPRALDTLYILKGTVTIPAGIERIIGCFAILHPTKAADQKALISAPMFKLTGSSTANTLVIEQFNVSGDAQNSYPVLKIIATAM